MERDVLTLQPRVHGNRQRTPGPAGTRVSSTAAAVLRLQQQVGNQAVAGLLRPGATLQRDLVQTPLPGVAPAPTSAASSPAGQGTASTLDTAWFVDYSQVPSGGKAAPTARTDDDRTGRHDRLVVEELQIGPGASHLLKGGNYAASGRASLGHFSHPADNGQVSGRVSYHQAKDIKIGVDVPAVAHLEGTPAPTARQQTQIETAVRDAAVASVHRQWEQHQGEDAAIEAQAAQDAKAAFPEGMSGIIKVTISVGGPVARHWALPSVDYKLDGPSNCYVTVQVPTSGFVYRARSETSKSRRAGEGETHGSSTDTEAGVAVSGSATASKSKDTVTDTKLKASIERRTRTLVDYQKAVKTSFIRDFGAVWRDIGTKWETQTSKSSDESTEKDFTVNTHAPEAEERLKKQSEDEKDPSLWERAKKAVKGFVIGKVKGWIAEGAEKILGKNIVFRLVPGSARKWVFKTLVDLGWNAGGWLWDKITGKAKTNHTPEDDVSNFTPTGNEVHDREEIHKRFQSYGMTATEFKEQSGHIATHFESAVSEAVHQSFETEFGMSASVDTQTTTGTHDSSSGTVSGAAGAKSKTHSDSAGGKGSAEASSESHTYETEGIRVEGGEPVISLLVRPLAG